MSIVVSAIPRLLGLATPDYTLGTTNSGGSAVTAVRSDATLLVFDGVAPSAVAASPVVGTATVSSRRDHVHSGTTGAGTVVDEAITRFNGTGGASLQGYSSLSPTISDAGIISLTSGALKFPATAISSTEGNTLWDYEIGTWTPTIADDSQDGTGEGQAYSVQLGNYTKIGRVVYASFSVTISNLGSLTTGQNARVMGLPFTSTNTGQYSATFSVSQLSGTNIVATANPVGALTSNQTGMQMFQMSLSSGLAIISVGQLQAGGSIRASGFYIV
jgi:hypothetical protein|tara:strand:+ start:281 stop:1099 length:819 start_codon:yes stop_codon:yes gene_type:complete